MEAAVKFDVVFARKDDAAQLTTITVEAADQDAAKELAKAQLPADEAGQWAAVQISLPQPADTATKPAKTRKPRVAKQAAPAQPEAATPTAPAVADQPSDGALELVQQIRAAGDEDAVALIRAFVAQKRAKPAKTGNTNRYEGSLSQKWDLVLIEGGTWAAMAESLGVTAGRLRAHSKYRTDVQKKFKLVEGKGGTVKLVPVAA